MVRVPLAAGALNGRIAFYTTNPYRLFVMNADSTCRYEVPLPYDQLPIVASPQWSADGYWLTFHGGVGLNAQIYIVRPDGSGFHRVTDGHGDLVEPSFSPNGLQIVFGGPDGRALYTINTYGTDMRRIPVNGSFPKWWPLGDKIIYSNWGQTYESDLFLYDLTTSESHQITHHEPGQAFCYASWSPDGERLTAHVSDPTRQKWDIWIMDMEMDADPPNVSNRINLTGADWPMSNEIYPAWSPNGQYIVFQSDKSGNSDIWYTPVNHFESINITNSPENELMPAITGPVEPVDITAIRIREAVAEKVEALGRIDAALEEEWAVYETLEELLESGDYGDLKKGEIVAAKQKIHSAIQHQEQSKKALEKSIENLEDSLALLGGTVLSNTIQRR